MSMTNPTPTAATPDSLAKLRAMKQEMHASKWGNWTHAFYAAQVEQWSVQLREVLDALSAQQAAVDARGVEAMGEQAALRYMLDRVKKELTIFDWTDIERYGEKFTEAFNNGVAKFHEAAIAATTRPEPRS